MKIFLVGNKRKYTGDPKDRGCKGGWFEELFREELIRTPKLDVYPFGWGYCDEEYKSGKTVPEKIEELGGVDVILVSYNHWWIRGFNKLKCLKVHFTVDFYDNGFEVDRCFTHYHRMKYDVMFGYGSIIVDKLNRENIHGSHYLLPMGVDIGVHRKLGVEKKYDVGCFYNTVYFRDATSFYSFRIKIRDMLKEMPVSQWTEPVFFHGMVKKINECKIILNYTPIPLVNARVTEVLACGTLLLTNYCEDYTKFGYKDGKHLVFYDGLDDLADKINYYLKHGSRREKIASSGRRFVRKYFNNSRRVKDITKIIKGHL